MTDGGGEETCLSGGEGWLRLETHGGGTGEDTEARLSSLLHFQVVENKFMDAKGLSPGGRVRLEWRSAI